jgi:hypothetical protein
MNDPILTPETARRFAIMTLGNVKREYPHVRQQVLTGGDRFESPREQHPIFFGCFDWHSCVHGYWQLARLLRAIPELALRDDIRCQFDQAFTGVNVRAEIDFFNRPTSRGFERPYGWAWLLELATELKKPVDDGRETWHAAILPLATLIAARLAEFLPKAIYPSRAGTHSNTAFAMTLSHAYARSHGDAALAGMIEARVRDWHENDVDAQAWEPSLEDFLSPTLMEAACLQGILPDTDFQIWLGQFLPRLHAGEPATIFAPAIPSDRTDGRIAHLDGLNFSRAWCMKRLASSLRDGDPRIVVLRRAADAHIRASLPHIAEDYAGEHWLATFALLAILG